MDKNKILAIAIKIMGLFFLFYAVKYLILLIVSIVRLRSENEFENVTYDAFVEQIAGVLLFGAIGIVFFLSRFKGNEPVSKELDDEPAMAEKTTLSFDSAKLALRLFGLYIIATEGASLLSNLLWQIRFRFMESGFYNEMDLIDFMFELAYPLCLVVFGIIIFRAPNWLLNKLR